MFPVKSYPNDENVELLELVTLEEEMVETYGGEQKGYTMKLKMEFNWFKSNEFKQLWRLKQDNAAKPTKKRPNRNHG